MLSRQTGFAAASVVLMLLALAMPILAQGSAGDAGQNFLTTLEDTITGNIGFFIGLAVTILGLWTWIVKQETGAGITMIIGGVLITLVPGIFNGVREAATGVLGQFSGSGRLDRVGE